MIGYVKIIGHTTSPDKIASSGARISTTKGDSLAIFESATDTEQNHRLIKKVLASGHKSLVEHIYFNLAFVNVSAYVEQFMLEFRLASFTVKSRRYVDFSNMGFVMPSFVDEKGFALSNIDEMRSIYSKHMSFLFGEYQAFVDAGIPKEDARFLLPYCYKSNFYCTVNARELCNILYSMMYGRGKGHSEIKRLGKALLSQAIEICPYIYENLNIMEVGLENKYEQLSDVVGIVNDEVSVFDNSVELLSYTQNPENAVVKAALIGFANLKTERIESVVCDKKQVKQIVDIILSNRRPRELEQINFTFRINNISLAAITHFTRHRIQSIIIPPLQDVCKCQRFIIPDTVISRGELLQRYKDAYAKTKDIYEVLFSNGLNKYEISYLYLSGNVIDITTTMNGRELLTFIGLRSCNRTQWETRGITVKMLNLLREVSPLLFNHFGPRCYVEGKCPERNMTCGKCCEMNKKYNEPKVAL